MQGRRGHHRVGPKELQGCRNIWSQLFICVLVFAPLQIVRGWRLVEQDHVVLRRVISTPGGEVRPLQGSHFALGQGAVTGGAPTGCYASQNSTHQFHIFVIKPNSPQFCNAPVQSPPTRPRSPASPACSHGRCGSEGNCEADDVKIKVSVFVPPIKC